MLKTSEPCLNEIKQVLGRFAAAEKDSGAAPGSPGLSDEKLIGVIDPSEPQILQAMRKELRLRHLALETERAYVGWIVRFIRHCGDEIARILPEFTGLRRTHKRQQSTNVTGGIRASLMTPKKTRLLALLVDF